jgi:small subunit ribosomal protein S8
MMTDPLADMLTRIRNANRIERAVVDMPLTKLKKNIAQVLKDEGFIRGYEVGATAKNDAGQTEFQAQEDAKGSKAVLRIVLKYGDEGERVIRRIERASKPGRRLYRRSQQIEPVLDGLGIAIVSTNRGVMSDRQARAQRLGGELLCTVW